MTERRKKNQQRNIGEFARQCTELESRPLTLLVELTQNCNLNCPSCRSQGPYRREWNMKPEVFDRAAEELFDDAMIVDLRGWGESLVYPRFAAMAERVLDSGAQLRIVTNGQVDKPDLWDRMMSCGSLVSISCDADRVGAARGRRRGYRARRRPPRGARERRPRRTDDHRGPRPGWSDEELARWLANASVPHTRPADTAEVTAQALAENLGVGYFQGRSEFGPRALGHRSILAHPGSPRMTERLNDVKGREQFRPVAPMVALHRAADVFEGPLPSPYMLFTHRVRPQWREIIPAAVHVDGSARIQTVDAATESTVARILDLFERRTGIPAVINTSFNTAEQPMVDHPRDALACFATAPIDVLVLGPFAIHRNDLGSTRVAAVTDLDG